MKSFQLSDQVDKTKVFILDKSELGRQFAPYFYKSEYVDLLNRLRANPFKKLGAIARFSDETWRGQVSFERYLPYIEIGGVDTKTGRIKSIRKIPIDGAPNRAKMLIRTGDILISKTRPSKAAIALVDPEHDCYVASTGFSILREIRDESLLRDFLYIALRQPFCLKQLGQYSGEQNYAAISQEQLSNILIPHLDLPSQRDVVARVQRAYAIKCDKEQRAEALTASIDDYLAKSLGIALPEQRAEVGLRIFIAQYSQIRSGRLDANYSLPLFQASREAMRRGKFELRSIKSLAEGVFQGLGRKTSKQGAYALLKVKNIKQRGEIDLETKAFVDQVPASKVLIEGDVIAPFVGEAVRRCRFSVYHPDGRVPHTIDNNTGVIRLNTAVLNPYFAANFLSSSIGKRQIDQLIGGGVVPLLGSHNARDILLPVPPMEEQEEMAGHIRQLRQTVRQLRREGEEALEKAQHEVEQFVLNPKSRPALALEKGASPSS